MKRLAREGNYSPPRRAWLIGVALVWLVCSDLFRFVGIQGPLAGALAVTLLFPYLLALMSKSAGTPSRKLILFPFTAFLGWTVAISLFIGTNQKGLQNLSIYLLFVSAIVVVASRPDNWTSTRLLKAVRMASALGTIPITLFALISGKLDDRFIGTGTIPAVASMGLISSACLPRTWRTRMLTVVFVAAVFVSLSRAYIVFALVTLAIPAIVGLPVRKFVRRLIARTTIMSVIGFLAMTRYAPLRDRFVVNDGKSIGGLDIGTSGRDSLWATLTSDLPPDVLIHGHGAGAAETVITNVYVVLTQPHNDYLRFLYDYGIPGLCLWILGLWVVVLMLVRRLAATRVADLQAGYVAALLSLLFVAGNSFVDNTAVYVFVMLPVAVIVGHALQPTQSIADGLHDAGQSMLNSKGSPKITKQIGLATANRYNPR